MLIRFLLFLYVSWPSVLSMAEYTASISNNGPVVLGANITFRAEVFLNDKKQGGLFLFKWIDNLNPQQKAEIKQQGISEWTVFHAPENYTSGEYRVRVTVYNPTWLIDWPLCQAENTFKLKNYLVGKLVLLQNTTDEENVVSTYVSNATELIQTIKLQRPDDLYLKRNTSSWSTQWLIDGNIVDVKNKSTLTHLYNEPDKSHHISAQIFGIRIPHTSNSSLPPTASVSSSPLSTAEIDINGTDSPLANSTNAVSLQDKAKLSYSTEINIVDAYGISNRMVNCSDPVHYICGFFSTDIEVKAPVVNVQIKGSGWLEHGQMLDLQITCDGSPPFKFCDRKYIGTYNKTGNETCRHFPEVSGKCEFNVTHYFSESKHYTVLIIIKNDVHTFIQAFGVDIYEGVKHPQLSVIVVPVAASALAVILIIFGFAFYFQNRNSYVVEVADFDFANNSDMEYKTFKERLVEAIHNALYKTEEFPEEDSFNGVPCTSNKKYGSMQ